MIADQDQTHRVEENYCHFKIKVYPPSEIFEKLLNKNAIKHQKDVPSKKYFHNPYIPSFPKFGKNLIDPPPRVSNRVHLCMTVTKPNLT